MVPFGGVLARVTIGIYDNFCCINSPGTWYIDRFFAENSGPNDESYLLTKIQMLYLCHVHTTKQKMSWLLTMSKRSTLTYYWKTAANLNKLKVGKSHYECCVSASEWLQRNSFLCHNVYHWSRHSKPTSTCCKDLYLFYRQRCPVPYTGRASLGAHRNLLPSAESNTEKTVFSNRFTSSGQHYATPISQHPAKPWKRELNGSNQAE